MSAHEHDPGHRAWQVSLEDQDGKQVDVTHEEMAALVRLGRTTLACPECDATFLAGTEHDLSRQARESFDHMKQAHGYTDEQVKQANIKVRIDPCCPRCRGQIPPPASGKLHGEGPGRALSRTSTDTDLVWVCEPCGREEAYEQMASTVSPRDRWPVANRLPPKPAYRQPTWDQQRSNRRARPSPPPTPREVPDLRLHLMERWLPGGIFDRDVSTRRRQFRHPYDETEGAKERSILAQASLWWLRPDMVDLTTAAAVTIPDDVAASELELPADQSYGLAVLGGPWIGMDAEDAAREARVDAISWGIGKVQGEPAISLSFYQYLDFTMGMTPDQLAGMGQMVLHEAGQEEIGRRADDPAQVAYRLTGGAWAWLGRTDWPLDLPLTSLRHPDINPTAHQQKSIIEDRRWFAAFSLLINHRLTHTEPTYAHRQERRRQERAGVVHREPATVKIVRLREAALPVDPDAEPGEAGDKARREYTHRWVSSGHTGWRRCGPRHTLRKRTYISPSIKGPKDKPLVIKDTVRVWRR